MKFSTELFIQVMRRPMGETEMDWIPVGEGPGYFDLDTTDEIALYLPRAEDETVLIMADEWLGCPMLRMIDISEGRRVTDKGLRAIARMHQLTMLNVGSCGISNVGLESVVKMPNLIWLDLSHCTGIGDLGLRRMEKMTHLEYIDLHGLPRPTTGGYKRLAKRKSLKIRR